jgi:hypothetical protein
MGPSYGFYGLGTALSFVTQGVGSNMWTMIANAVRRDRCASRHRHSRMGKPIVRAGIGVFLVLYSLYMLFRPKTASVTVGGATADAGVRH